MTPHRLQRRREHPILFSAPMVRSVLRGEKTETRRVIKSRAGSIFNGEWSDDYILDPGNEEWRQQDIRWQPGDTLWVREAFAFVGDNEDDIHACPDLRIHAYYRADSVQPEAIRWRPSIHMPRWASRITLEVLSVRVERLQEITEEGARAEGITDGGCLTCGNPEPCGCADPKPDARDAFAGLWHSIHGSDSWHANPWVTVTTFRRVECGPASEVATDG